MIKFRPFHFKLLKRTLVGTNLAKTINMVKLARPVNNVNLASGHKKNIARIAKLPYFMSKL